MTKPNYVRVIIDRAIHRELDYAVPEGLMSRVGVGSRVRVPFREKSALATVVAVHGTERSERHPADRSGRRRSADLERTIARASADGSAFIIAARSKQ